MKYMVMECHLSYAVVLDEQGRFLKVANLHYEVGQMVTDIVEMQQPDKTATKRKGSRWIYSLAAMAACLLLVITSFYRMGNTVYGSVFLTINPAVRVDVNRSDIVVGLEGSNEDGKNLITDYHYQRKDLNLVMDELVQRAIDMGYLHRGGQITLTLDADDDQWISSRSASLFGQLNERLTESLNVTITVTDKNSKDHEVIIPVPPENIHDNSGSSDPVESDDAVDYRESTPPQNTPEPTTSQAPAYGESDYGMTDYGVPGDDGPDEDLGDDSDDGDPDKDDQDDEPDRDSGDDDLDDDVPGYDDGPDDDSATSDGQSQTDYFPDDGDVVDDNSQDEGKSNYHSQDDDDNSDDENEDDDENDDN